MRVFGRRGAKREALGIFAGAVPVVIHHPERTAKRREHAETEQVYLQQLEVVEVVFIPLHDRAIFHGGVFYGHELIKTPLRDDDAADVLGEMPRELHDLSSEMHDLKQHGARWIYARFAHTLLVYGVAVPPLNGLGETRDLQRVETESLADIA